MRWLLHLRAALVTATFAISAFVADGEHLKDGFFEAAAQIIPVLLLALALQGGMLSPAVGRPFATDLLGSLFLFVTFLTGELIALEAVASGEASPDEGVIVIAVLAAGFVGSA